MDENNSDINNTNIPEDDENKEPESVEQTNDINDVKTIDDKFIDNIFKDNVLDLYKLEGIDVKDQSKVFSLVLTSMYATQDEIDFDIIRKSALKCLKLSCDPEDNEVHLPNRLIVKKDNHKMVFSFEEQAKKNMILFIIILGFFIFAAIGSTYAALYYLSIESLNKDIDGDGIPDINLDINLDNKAEINIDIDSDDKPDVNIDYMGNRKSIFNIDTDNDEKPDSNLVNRDKNNDGKCDINCDTNDDGWPDLNLDIDGDGVIDMYRDTDNDKIANLDFDMDGDGVCDLHCDTNRDDKCDKYCLANLEEVEHNNNGSSAVIGNNAADIETAEFVVEYVESNSIIIDDLYPDDQEGLAVKHPIKKFTIENKSSLYAKYIIDLTVSRNTFTSNNFKYMIESTNNGYTQDWTIAPKNTVNIKTGIVIPPKTKQTYTFTFKLQGVGGKQDYDQGKSFSAQLNVYLEDY